MKNMNLHLYEESISNCIFLILIMKHIPNLFTLLNLFFGCLAIVFILQNGITDYYE